MHSPAGKGLKCPAGRWRWGDAEIQTSAEVSRPGSASEIPGQDLGEQRDSNRSRAQFIQVEQRQDWGAQAGTTLTSAPAPPALPMHGCCSRYLWIPREGAQGTAWALPFAAEVGRIPEEMGWEPLNQQEREE